MCGARHAHWQIPDGIVARRGFKTTRVKRVVLGENRIETLPGRIIQSRHICASLGGQMGPDGANVKGLAISLDPSLKIDVERYVPSIALPSP